MYRLVRSCESIGVISKITDGLKASCYVLTRWGLPRNRHLASSLSPPSVDTLTLTKSPVALRRGNKASRLLRAYSFPSVAPSKLACQIQSPGAGFLLVTVPCEDIMVIKADRDQSLMSIDNSHRKADTAFSAHKSLFQRQKDGS